MSTSRPFAYNTGAPIAGTEQVGSLAVGYPSGGFSGFEWWNGPDEDLGYVIACSVPGDTQPTPVAGVDASVGFFQSGALTENSFISLANVVASPSGGPFASGSAAKTWLNSNGYWTSFGGGGGTGDFNVTISQVGNDVVWSGSGSFNLTALTSAGPGSVGAGYAPNQAIWAIGPSAPVDTYIGTIAYPSIFGTNAVGVTSTSGSTFGILPGGSGRSLYVPSGYVSNTNISGTATYANTTIASAGLTPGTYTWSWGSGANASSLVMTIN